MNLTVNIEELLILQNFIQKQQDEMSVSNLNYIVKTYKSILESIPYNWYLSKNLFYEDMEGMLDGSGKDLDCLYTNIEILITRLRVNIESSNTYVSVKFEDLKKYIIDEIRKSKFKIDIAVAWLSDRDICYELKKASKNNVMIKILMLDDTNNYNCKSLLGDNIDVKFAKRDSYQGGNFMHNKFSVFDSDRIITGSYNWSYSARTHDENIVLIFNCRIAKDYEQKFNELWLSKY